MTTNPENQKLVDIMYSIAVTLHMCRKNFVNKTTEEVAEWVTAQLRGSGFYTRPVGISRGSLYEPTEVELRVINTADEFERYRKQLPTLSLENRVDIRKKAVTLDDMINASYYAADTDSAEWKRMLRAHHDVMVETARDYLHEDFNSLPLEDKFDALRAKLKDLDKNVQSV